MAKKQLKTQMRKLRTREVVSKRREGKTTDRLIMSLNSKRQNNLTTNFNDYAEWDDQEDINF